MIHDRCEGEDLLRESRALTPRVQFQVRLDDEPATVFAGFRGESLSLYFGHDPVFHFNADGELRRAFVDGRLVKAEDGQLVGMQRIRTPEAVELRSERFSADAQQQLLDDVARALAQMRAAFAADRVTIEGQIPPDGDAITRLMTWLQRNQSPTAAASPRVR